MSASGKDVIYIDVDDEITTIIDKVRSSGERIVALVLPKRSTVLQSVVNMKLLKRTSEDAKKHLVLITSEAGLLPLAGNIGLHVAKSLQSKPEIPAVPGALRNADDEEDVDEPAADESASKADKASAQEDDLRGRLLDKTRPVGDLASAAGTAMSPMSSDPDEETIELDDDAPIAASGVLGAVVGGAKSKKDAKDRRFKIPNFNKFRTWILIGMPVLIVLIFGAYLALSVMPKASVTIKTNSTAVQSNLDIKLRTGSTAKLDVTSGIVPAQSQQSQRSAAQTVDATGQKNNGTKASGSVTFSLNDCSQAQVTIPSGSGLSASGLAFITQQAVTLQSVKVGSNCKNSSYPTFSTATVTVIAQNAGAQYNLADGQTYVISGLSNVSVRGTAMTGGTDNIIKIVQQADIDNAKSKLSAQDTTAVKQELQSGLTSKGLFALPDTLTASDPKVTTDVSVGATADKVTVTQAVAYTMSGVNQDDIKAVIANDVNGHIDPTKQKILDYGLSVATFKLQSQQGKDTLVSMFTTAVAGSDLDLNAVKKQVAGKKSSDAKQIIQANPGVTDVTVSYSPFWVSSIPKNVNKITVVVQKPQAQNASSQ